jgi:ligand-binding SRPBCC domain-containing protein
MYSSIRGLDMPVIVPHSGVTLPHVPTIRLETLIRAPAERCFDLSVDVDVHQASVPATLERAVGGTTSGRMGLGDQVTWEARHLGKLQRLTSQITAFDRPHRFVDEMVSGAFKSFRHEHIFEPSGDATLMVDVFDYESPLGPFGRLADVLFLRRYMAALLETRNRHLKALAELRHSAGTDVGEA